MRLFYPAVNRPRSDPDPATYSSGVRLRLRVPARLVEPARGGITPGGVEGPMCCTSFGAGDTECVAQGTGTLPEPVGVSCTNASSPPGYPTYPYGEDASVLLDDGGYPIYDDAGYPIYEDAGYEDAGSEEAGTTYPDDASCGYEEDAGSTFPVGYDGGTGSLCPVCPAGWNQDQVQPELCCQNFPGGLILCFSQAVGSATLVNGAEDAGVGFSTPPSPGSSSGSTGANP